MKINSLILFLILSFNTYSFAQEQDSTGNFTGNYFFTSSAITLEKSESMIVWNLWGPEYTYGITSNFQIGAHTTWFASPLALSADLSIPLIENLNVSLGGFYGAEWTSGLSESSGGINAKITLGDRNRNISTTLYGFNLSGEGFGQLYSISTYLKHSRRSAFIFETYIFEVSDEIGGLLIPGIQHQTKRDRFLHAGFAIFFYDEVVFPLPIPFAQLHVPIN